MGLDPVLAWSASFVGSRPSCLFWGSMTDMGRGGGGVKTSSSTTRDT